jgi:hypothetical protein
VTAATEFTLVGASVSWRLGDDSSTPSCRVKCRGVEPKGGVRTRTETLQQRSKDVLATRRRFRSAGPHDRWGMEEPVANCKRQGPRSVHPSRPVSSRTRSKAREQENGASLVAIRGTDKDGWASDKVKQLAADVCSRLRGSMADLSAEQSLSHDHNQQVGNMPAFINGFPRRGWSGGSIREVGGVGW